MRVPLIAAFIVLPILASHASADLIGAWTFDSPKDAAGNFGDLILRGDASLTGGQLDVNGTFGTPTGWAFSGGTYTGPQITDKTLISWVTLEGLNDVAVAGSALTLDRQDLDRFDAIVLGERQPNRWMNGSDGFARTQDFVPGFEETTTGEQFMLAFTYEHLGGGQIQITGYRNSIEIGTYEEDTASVWETGNAEVVFGARHDLTNGVPIGAIDALIDEARVYDNVLTQQEIQDLFAAGPIDSPTPGDANRDGSVNIDDYILIRSNLFQADPLGAPYMGDNTNDGFVDFDDFYDWKNNFSGGPAAAEAAIAALGVPEPSACALAALGLATLLSAVRRNGAAS